MTRLTTVRWPFAVLLAAGIATGAPSMVAADSTSPVEAEPSTTTADPADPTTTTATPTESDPDAGPTPTPSSTTTTVPQDTSTTETTIDPADPLSFEEEGEDAPAVDITVPAKGGYGDQDPFGPPEILWSSVEAAERKMAELQAERVEVIADVRRLRVRRKELLGEQVQLTDQSRAAIDELGDTTDRLTARSIAGFRRYGTGNSPQADSFNPDYGRIVEHQRRAKMVAAAVDVDRGDLADLADLRASLDRGAARIVEHIRIVHDTLSEAESDVVDLAGAHDQARVEYEAFKAGSEIFIDGIDFPIAGPYSPVYDSFGFPRMPGTPDEHWHEGIDLFAPRGTPLVATERGVITRVGNGRLGGLKFWLKGESGAEWYYAHLDSFAPGLVDGLVVEAGQLVGYVGNTGNAITTPPHLHMQLHPDGGRPVNPFPLLKVVSDLDRAAMEAGTHPGFRYEPVVRGGDQAAAGP